MIRSISHPKFKLLILIIFIFILAGMVLFSLIEGWGIIDALYFTVSTMTTVGLGDLVPTHALSKFLTTLYMLVSVPFLLIAMEIIAESVYERMLKNASKRKSNK